MCRLRYISILTFLVIGFSSTERCHVCSAESGIRRASLTQNEQPPKGHTKDSLETVRKRLASKKAVLADVRENREWNAGHLKAASLVPLSQLRENAGNKEFAKQLAKSLPKGKIVYCHCKSGGRVLIAAPILRKFGYDVRPLSAGYGALLKAGFKKAP